MSQHKIGKGLKVVLYISLEDKNKKFTSCWFAETSEKRVARGDKKTD